EYAYNNGVTVVAAAGNASLDYVYYPARSQYTIAVGATNYDNKLASFSNYGPRLDLVAPGNDIFSTHKFNNVATDEYDYIYMSGTSMAAPQVSGAAALIMSKYGRLSPEEIKDRLVNTADWIDGGYQLLDTANALDANADNNDYDSVQTFAAERIEDGNDITYNVVSEKTNPNKYGDYHIRRGLTDKDIVIVGWVDSDNSGTINDGDLFDDSFEDNNRTIKLEQGETKPNIGLYLTPKDSNTTFSNKNIQITN
ncbi:MAG: S8 family peptidase, partial [Halothermotrichaceae bacterium]